MTVKKTDGSIPHINQPIGKVTINGKAYPVYIELEWHKRLGASVRFAESFDETVAQFVPSATPGLVGQNLNLIVGWLRTINTALIDRGFFPPEMK